MNATVTNAIPAFVLQPGAKSKGSLQPPTGSQLISAKELRIAGVGGTTIRMQPSWGDRWPAASIATCQSTGDDFTLLLMAGFDKDPTSDAAINARIALVEQLAHRYGDHPHLAYFHIPAVTPLKGPSEERYCGDPMPLDFISSNITLISETAAIVPNRRLLLALCGDDVSSQMRLVGAGLGVAPGRLVCKINNLGPQTDLGSKTRRPAPHVELLIDACRSGAGLGFELARAYSAADFKLAMAKARAISDLVGKPIEYLGPYRQNLTHLRG